MNNNKKLLSLIRQHCLKCCGGSRKDVELCTSGPDASPFSTCVLWPYRLGEDPKPSKSRAGPGKKSKSKTLIPNVSNDTIEVQIAYKNP
jgi:hypothetical protein